MDHEQIRSIFGVELVAEREGDVIRLGSREQGHDLTFAATSHEALEYLRQIAAAAHPYGTSAPLEGFVFLGPGAEDRLDERPDVDGAIEKLRTLTDRVEDLEERADMEDYAPTIADVKTLYELALAAWGCLERSWDGEGLVT